MPFKNITTGTWGHNIWEVRAAHPEVSIPDGATYADWHWYAPVPAPPHDPATHYSVEVGPGQWELRELPAPTACSRRQGRLALHAYGLLDQVEAAIADAADPVARIDYEADPWELDNPTLRAMWAALGGSEQELKNLFKMAVTL